MNDRKAAATRDGCKDVVRSSEKDYRGSNRGRKRSRGEMLREIEKQKAIAASTRGG